MQFSHYSDMTEAQCEAVEAMGCRGQVIVPMGAHGGAVHDDGVAAGAPGRGEAGVVAGLVPAGNGANTRGRGREAGGRAGEAGGCVEAVAAVQRAAARCLSSTSSGFGSTSPTYAIRLTTLLHASLGVPVRGEARVDRRIPDRGRPRRDVGEVDAAAVLQRQASPSRSWSS